MTLSAPAGPMPAPTRAARCLVAAVRAYQRLVSRRTPAACRLSPTCSTYAVEAVQRHGAARGLRLALARLARCRPGGPVGADPVPSAPVTPPPVLSTPVLSTPVLSTPLPDTGA